MSTIPRKHSAPHRTEALVDAPPGAGEFLLDEAVHYLNHAAVGAMPRRTGTAVAHFCDEAMRRPTVHYGRWLKAEASLRARLARLLGDRDPADLSLLANTSHAISLVASGLPWEAGDSVVLPKGEFPSNCLPWKALAARGVEVREVGLGDGHDPRALLAACDRSTRLVAASWVRYDTGAKLDLESLAGGCRARGIRLFIDAIQGLGAVAMPPVDADFIAGGAHKWLLGPEGVGYLWARPEARECLSLIQHGWRMLEDPFDFDRKDRPTATDGRRFEPGTVNMMGFVALEASLSLLEELTMERVEAAIRERVAELRAGLEGHARLEIVTPSAPAASAGILAMTVAGDRNAPERVLERLSGEGVVAAVRGRCLRFSPHCYTPAAKIEQVLRLVHDALATA